MIKLIELRLILNLFIRQQSNLESGIEIVNSKIVVAIEVEGVVVEGAEVEIVIVGEEGDEAGVEVEEEVGEIEMVDVQCVQIQK
jgi:hypothetical protein